jgi:predicted CoA-substrate-specific enzyme activase
VTSTWSPPQAPRRGGSVRTRIGVDAGALTVKAVVLDPSSDQPRVAYRFHRGDPAAGLRDALEELAVPADGCEIAVAVSGSAHLPPGAGLLMVDAVQATIAAVRGILPGARNILDIGGAGLRFIRLDADGRFAHFAANSQCAAGTGSFLDEQATRLGLDHARMAALASVADPPPVATRCAVFAKSDLIHLQQAGATLEQMWSGLCRGMAQTALQTLLRGKPLGGPTVLVGGVAQNREVLRWIAALADAPVSTCAHAHVIAALGAAIVAGRNGNGRAPVQWRSWLDGNGHRPLAAARPTVRVDCCSTATSQRPPAAFPGGDAPAGRALELRRTKYPSFDLLASFTDDAGNEVRVSRWPAGEAVAGYLGIDVGSTSTKLCLVDARGDVLVDVYRKTAGDPIGATQKLFQALRDLETSHRARLRILGCGTTGSGRKLVGAVVGADAVVNEISAHVAGAMHVDPTIETIFEIGGQDSKYMRTRNGAIADSTMNYVCAAGTGSFVEEQARKLGVPLHEVGDRVLGLVPPSTTDRCTVFMEQDVNDLVRVGHDVDHALAAVMRSVVQNYLNKVVGNRHWSRTKIGFQGATARNKGLVAAFETLLGVEVVVSPYCHVMGAWGVALLTREEVARAGRPTSFAGLELSRRRIELRRERCDLCNNSCDITFARVEGAEREPSWGYLCGRDPSDAKVRVHREYDLFRQRQRWLLQAGAAAAPRSGNGRAPARVVLPRALTFFSHLPFWQRLLGDLGARVELAPESSRSTRERGAALVGAEFCFPVKLAHGQAGEALDAAGADLVLAPRMVAQAPVDGQSDTYFCPYVQAFPSVVEAATTSSTGAAGRLLAPCYDRRLPEERQVEVLEETLGAALGVSRKRLRDAHRAACSTQERFEARCRDAGREALEKLARENRPGIVLVGRPYNVMDASANLDLPKKIAEMGYTVLPVDFLPFEPERLPARHRNLYWAYGQRILSALQFVRRHDNLFAIYFTNFNCGPDSFLLSFAEEIMGTKPMLALELDEHGADAGYITRIEAYLDVVRHWRPAALPAVRPAARAAGADAGDLRRRRIWIPAMHPTSTALFAAAFRGAGLDAVAMPVETRADLEHGQRLARGCECLPMRTTIGSFANTLGAAAASGRQHTLFMPTARGPCRFGQYATLDRLILDRMDQSDVTILSPSGDNAYCGLPAELRRWLWKALLAADVLEKLACRVRPYETTAGDAGAALARWREAACRAFERRTDVREVVRRAGQEFARLPVRREARPLVGVVGEIYVRSNPFCNEDLVRSIERAGGEVWSAPIPEWILFTTWLDAYRSQPPARTPREVLERARRRLRLRIMQNSERAFHHAAGPLLAGRDEPGVASTIQAGQHYIPFNVGGETLISLGRAVHFVRQGARLIVNASPFGCMPGTIAAGLFARFEKETGVPVVNLFYEGTGGANRQLDVFLANLGARPDRLSHVRPPAPAPERATVGTPG